LKTCTSCGTEKPYDQYITKKRNKDGVTAMCRECTLPRSRQQYKEKPEPQKKAVKERKSGHRARVTHYKVENPCADCQKFYPSYVMQFDHVRGIKKAGISQMISDGYSWNEIEEEIQKCELVCANCHAERTFMRLGVSQLDYYHEDYQLD
jgi:hypothetical protein